MTKKLGMASAAYPKEVTEGSVSVRIFRQKRKDGYVFFQLAYYNGGTRKRESIADETEALERARAVAKTISDGHGKVADLNPSEAYQFREAQRLLEKAGFKDRTVLDVVAHYTRIWKPTVTSRTISQIIADFRKSIDAKSAAYKRTSRFRLDVFNKQFGRRHIETISTDEVCAFIDARTHNGESIVQRTRWNWYNLLRTVWIYARKNSWLPSDHPALPEDVPYSKGDGAYSLCTVDDLNKLIRELQARPDADMLVPYVYLMAYAGIRTEEAKRLTWEDIKVEGPRGSMEQRLTSIEVPRGKGKLKTERRSVNINKALEAKLGSYLQVEFKNEYNEDDYKDRTGPIVTYATADAIVRKIAKKAGIPWKHNMLRHTYITHFLRISERLELVADQCGTSVKMIKSNYRELGTLDQAVKWFAYDPALVDQVGIRNPQEVSAKKLKAKMGW